MIAGQPVTVQTTSGGTTQVHHLQQPATVVYAQPAPYNPIREHYASKASHALGVVQCVIGALACVLDIIGMIVEVGVFFVGSGIWCGIIFIVSGVLGIYAAKRKTVCLIVSFMVMSIIAAILSIMGLLVVYSISAGIDSVYHAREGQLALDCIMIFMALVECVVAIISSAICCTGTCCYSNTSQGYTRTVTTQPVIIQTAAGQQQVIYQMQPAAGQVIYTAPQVQQVHYTAQPAVPPAYTSDHPPVYEPNAPPPPEPGTAYTEAGVYQQGGTYPLTGAYPPAAGYPHAGAPPQGYPQKM